LVYSIFGHDEDDDPGISSEELYDVLIDRIQENKKKYNTGGGGVLLPEHLRS